MALRDGSREYEPYEQGIEVTGEAIQAVIDGVGQFSTVSEQTTRSLFVDNGLPPTPKLNEWYALSTYLDGIDSMVEAFEDTTIERIGKQLTFVVDWPGPRSSVEAAMATLASWFRRTHRGGNAGTIGFERTGPDSGRVRCETPYPCALERGMISGLSSHAGSALVTVTEVGHCREEGGDNCVYELSW